MSPDGQLLKKKESKELWFLCTALLLNDICTQINFKVDITYTFQDMLQTKLSTKVTKGNNSKEVQQGLQFLCTALSLDDIYIHMKFEVDISNTVQDMLRTKIKYLK